MVRHSTALLAAAIFAAAGGTGVAHPGHPPIPTPTVEVAEGGQAIPFELFRGNRILIPARVNGHETHVLLDTGASMSTLDRDYAWSIGIPKGFKIPARGAGGGLAEAEMVSGLAIEAGGLRIGNATVGVMDLGPLSRSLGMPVHAIFGREIFNSAIVSIDWGKRQLRIRSPHAFKPQPGAVALTLNKIGPFNTIRVSVSGAPPIEALLDLGNGAALSLPRSYWAAHPEITGLRSAATVAGGVGGIRAARAATIPEVTLAGATLKAVPALLTDESNDQDPTQMANVGIGLLQQFAVDLDLGRDRIYLSRRTDPPAFDRDRAGVRLDLLGDRLKASFVSPDGPAAAAGLKEGDEIVSVDGKRVTPAYYQGGDWTREQAGKTVTLIRADGSKLTVKLTDFY
jgi:predicted aspartyl protease